MKQQPPSINPVLSLAIDTSHMNREQVIAAMEFASAELDRRVKEGKLRDAQKALAAYEAAAQAAIKDERSARTRLERAIGRSLTMAEVRGTDPISISLPKAA